MTIITNTIVLGLVGLISLGYYQVNRVLKKIPSHPFIDWVTLFIKRKPFNVAAQEAYLGMLHGSKVMRAWQYGGWGVVVSCPETISKILGNTELYPKLIFGHSHPDSILGRAMGTNLLFSNHDQWKRFRRVLSPPFKRGVDIQPIAKVTENLCQVIDEKLESGQISVFGLIQRLTLDFLGYELLDLELNTLLADKVEFIDRYNEVMVASLDPFYLAFPALDKKWNPFRRPLGTDFEWLDNFLIQLVQGKTAALEDQSGKRESEIDLISLMVMASQGEPKLTIQEIRDNAMLLLLPSLTTSSTLVHVLHHLACQQDIQTKLRDEINQCGDLNDLGNIGNLPYLSAVIKETMRLNPAFGRLPPRVTTQPTEILGYAIPTGTTVTIDLYAMQRDPSIWQDPLQFHPDRFLTTTATSNKAWGTFGGGLRTCVGMKFALTELKFTVAKLVTQYRISYPTESNPDIEYAPAQLPLPTSVHLNFTKLSELYQTI